MPVPTVDGAALGTGQWPMTKEQHVLNRVLWRRLSGRGQHVYWSAFSRGLIPLLPSCLTRRSAQYRPDTQRLGNPDPIRQDRGSCLGNSECTTLLTPDGKDHAVATCGGPTFDVQ